MPPRRTAVAKQATRVSNPTSFHTQYINLYKEYSEKYGPRVAVLLQVGGFFEMYDLIHTQTAQTQANVQEVVEYLGRYVPPKPTPDPAWSTLFWGFPDHSLPLYERKLVEGNYTVVVIAQVTDAFGNVAGRELKYILSPGTYMDLDPTANDKTQEDRHIVGILIEPFSEQGKPKWYVASSAFHVTTGKAASTEDAIAIVDGKPVLDTFESFWALYQPAEVVVWNRCGLKEDQIRAWFRGYQGLIHVYTVPADALTPSASRGRAEFLHRLYEPDCTLSIAEYLGLEMYHQAFQCLAHLLDFVKTHTPSYLDHLQTHTFWQPEKELLLGNAALTQLAMLPAGKPHECLLHWIQKAQTAGGKRFLRERCLKPITDIVILEARQDRIAELRSLRSADMDAGFRGIFDVSRLHRTFQVGKGTATALTQLLMSYQKIQGLMERMLGTSSASVDSEAFQTYFREFSERWSLERIQMCGTDQIHGVGPAHPWVRGIHAHLDELEGKWLALTSQVSEIKTAWEGLMGEEGCLKLEWRNDAPFTLQTTKRRATCIQTVAKTRGLPAIQAVTKGSTSVVVLTNETLQGMNVRALEIWSAWTQAVANQWMQEWSVWEPEEGVVEWMSRLDAEYALARVAEDYGYVRPMYETHAIHGGLQIEDMRHPIIERLQEGVPYIPHSVALGSLASEDGPGASTRATAEHGILLYGVNAAGKSSLSKALGLCVVLAQCGIPVPAKAMRLAPYTALFTRIIGNDNLWAGMSSFVVEMTEFRSILRSAGPKTLVLGDELCAGTETISATAIVAAGIQTLVEKKTQFLFATHLHELMEMSEIKELPTVRAYHLSVQADTRPGGKLKYDRQLKRGSGSPMYGLEVCRGLDMDAGFLTKAIQIRKKLEATPALNKMSRYNAQVPVQACNICGSKHDLETHHIVAQQKADERGFVDAGKHKNDVGNLVVLCEECHSQHHTGNLTIHGWIQTTGGRCLNITRS